MTQVFDFVSADSDVMTVKLDEVTGQAFVRVTDTTTIIGPAEVVRSELDRIADALGMLLDDGQSALRRAESERPS